MRIGALVIYQTVTLFGRSISRRDDPGLCSKVLGTLNFPAPLKALPVPLDERVAGCGEITVVTGEELCRWINCQPSLRAVDSLASAGDCSASQRSSTAIREQFLFTLLEDCSFFAHLVLRCARGGDSLTHGEAPWCGAKPRPVSEIQRKVQPVTRSFEQPEQHLSAGATETSFPELETLWVEVASRHVRNSVCKGGRR